MAKDTDYTLIAGGRLLSLDFFRGITMFLLIAEGTSLFSYMTDPSLKGTIINAIGTQFHHHPWNGLRFWDLIQPFFMFIVGVALPFSVAKRQQHGASESEILRHAIIRAFLLLLFGWALYCIGPGRITWRFQNVLAQLSVTYLIAFLMMKRSFPIQLGFTLLLLLLTELTYRFFPVAGFNQPFVPDHNFGAYVDLLISGELSSGHWVSINAVPTTAHTMWGVLAGQLLMSNRTSDQKIKLLAIAGLIGVAAGYALNPLSPIIKRICTSSFVIVSGGWSLLALDFSYWLIDVRKVQNWVKPFAIIGMNCIFIYLFTNSGGSNLINRIARPFTMGLFSWTGELYAKMITSLVVWGILWYICYWLYKRKIFIKI
ncbi:acyltransferase family protein [Candidatus Neomarinimicrobiota bacterium]